MHPVLLELFSSLPRQGPGSREATRRAWAPVARAVEGARVLDAGCGSGAGARELLAIGARRVVAMDRSRELLARAAGAGGRGFLPVRGDLAAPPFRRASFDTVWSEGAAYLVGFDRALAEWRGLLVARGFLVVSELAWRAVPVPGSALDFWAVTYPAMRSHGENERACERAGYEVVDAFPLGADAWWSSFYAPMRRRIAELRASHAGERDALAALDAEEREIAVFEEHGDLYDYCFYVLRAR